MATVRDDRASEGVSRVTAQRAERPYNRGVTAPSAAEHDSTAPTVDAAHAAAPVGGDGAESHVRSSLRPGAEQRGSGQGRSDQEGSAQGGSEHGGRYAQSAGRADDGVGGVEQGVDRGKQGAAQPMMLPVHRWTLPFIVAGIAAVIAAGALAAGVASAPTEFTVWATAYLALVVGVVQAALGTAAGALCRRRPSTAVVASGFVLFNAGSAFVIAGTGLDGVVGWNTVLVDIGGVALIPAMALFLFMVRGARRGAWLYTYWAVVLVILVSMPIGLFLSRA